VEDAAIEQFQVLCLPENLLSAFRAEDLLDSQDAVDLAKRLREGGISCATSLELTPAAGTLQRRGGDLWLGIVWLLQPSAAAGFVKILSRKLKSDSMRNKGRWKVHIRLRIQQADGTAEISYAGDGQTLCNLLEGLKSVGKES